MSKILRGWADYVFHNAWMVLAAAFVLLALTLGLLRQLTLSTNINALMPENAQSVQTLERALEKIGNYASVQVVIEGDTPEDVVTAFAELKAGFDTRLWVQSAQYYEDVEVLIRHELLLMEEADLLELEADVFKSLSIYFAQELSNAFETDVEFTLGDPGVSGRSSEELDPERVEQFETMFADAPAERRNFTSRDELKGVLVVAPKPGNESLADAKIMIDDSQAIIEAYLADNQSVKIGITGRIASQVGQYNALIRDLQIGLGSAFLLIGLILLFAYRTFMSIPIIILPLILSILTTLAITAVTIGQLNLITAFLTLILFGLGIDFGVHNFARYVEERRAGTDVNEAIRIVVERTGRASFMAAITTAASFLALMFTQFRAFTEFGFIAGTGILLAFLSMYTVFPALIVVAEKMGWDPMGVFAPASTEKRGRKLLALKYPKTIVGLALVLLVGGLFTVPNIEFETNTKNLEATLSDNYQWAKETSKAVLGDSSWAVMIADSYDELIDINKYFSEKKNVPEDVRTIKKYESLLSYVPEADVQQRRLSIIRRLKETADRLAGLAPDKYEKGKQYLSVETLSVAALPPILRDRYLGIEDSPGYLFYVYPSVNMADSSEAGRFYDDAAQVTVRGKDFYSASESFVLVEMLGLMQSDAFRAVLLVTLTTALVVLTFFRKIPATLVVLVPPLCGVFLTLAYMGLFGKPNLSIMNMVILPSLVGISVDNGIHIVHRFVSHSPRPDLGYIMLTTGRAALLTTITTMIGFGGMITASVGGLRSLAFLAIIGFSLCLLMTWFLLPAILKLLSRSQETSA